MENEHGIANIVVVNNVVQNPMTSTPTPGKVQAMRLKVSTLFDISKKLSSKVSSFEILK